MDNLDADVVIIGGGLSGLTAAKILNDAGVDFHVLEASPRFGGRILGIRGPLNNEMADLGPTWVWPQYQSDVARWFDELQIETFDQYNDGDAVLDLDPASPPQFQPLPSQHGIKRPIGGPQAIIDRLIECLPNGRLHASFQVTNIKMAGDNIVVSGSHDSSAFEVLAKRIILALPLRILASTITIDFLNMDILGMMKSVPTWMATQAKAVVFYEEPFWRRQGLSGRVASRIGPMVEVHDNSASSGRRGALFGFIGVPPSIRKENSAALSGAVEAQLVRCFGDQAKDYTHLQIQDWAENEFICSTADLENEPQHPSFLPDVFRKPHMEGRIHFAVAETADNDPGLIAGAFQAGERAAKDVIGS